MVNNTIIWNVIPAALRGQRRRASAGDDGSHVGGLVVVARSHAPDRPAGLTLTVSPPAPADRSRTAPNLTCRTVPYAAAQRTRPPAGRPADARLPRKRAGFPRPPRSRSDARIGHSGEPHGGDMACGAVPACPSDQPPQKHSHVRSRSRLTNDDACDLVPG
jgi:hypothetical protein